MSLSMPVSAVMPAGTCTPGFTRLCHSKSTAIALGADDGDVDDAMHARRAACRFDVDEGHGRVGGNVQLSSIHVVLSSVYLSKACNDLSRPMPDCLKPPNGTVMSSAS